MKKYFFSALFVVIITIANLIVSYFGAWITPYVAFVMIGFEFTLRDYIHEILDSNKKLVMTGIVLTGGVMTYLVNAAALNIAIASSVAFVLANIADFGVYEWLIENKYLVKSNASNLASTLIDSFSFVFIAFGFSWAMLGIAFYQFVMKVVGGFFWSFLINKTVS